MKRTVRGSKKKKKKKRNEKTTWSTISQSRGIPGKVEKGATRRGREDGGWDYVIKAVTVHRTVIENRAQLVCTRRVTPGSCTCVIVVIPALSIRVPRPPEITRIRKHTTCGRARTRSACARVANEPPLIYKLPINRLWVADEIGYQLIYIPLSFSLSLSFCSLSIRPSSLKRPTTGVVPPVSIEGQDSQVAVHLGSLREERGGLVDEYRWLLRLFDMRGTGGCVREGTRLGSIDDSDGSRLGMFVWLDPNGIIVAVKICNTIWRFGAGYSK